MVGMDEDNKDCHTNSSDMNNLEPSVSPTVSYSATLSSSFSSDQCSGAEISQASPLPLFLGELINGLKNVTEIVDSHSESIKHSILSNDTSTITQFCNSLWMEVPFVINTSVEAALIHNEIECAPHYKDKTMVKMTDATS